MISLKSAEEIKRMRDAALIAMAAMEKMLAAVEPGVSTAELDDIAYRHIVGAGAKPSFKGYGGFPGTACISVNDEIVHGIPGHRRLKEGDIVSFDTGAYLKGYHSDMARTVGVGKISEEAEMLIRVTKESFFKGVEQAVSGARLNEIGKAVEKHARAYGLGVVTEFIGHGIGRDLHEDPEVPNYDTGRRGPVMRPGLVLAVEPMLTLGTHKVVIAPNEWTASTKDGSLSAHYENTIVITQDGPCDILTLA
ncbi:MAG: type I methionyl aminopeptidase [Clostridia bacterium]|nr:type I methionyl aminopeptidase [Clostridia bacterium]